MISVTSRIGQVLEKRWQSAGSQTEKNDRRNGAQAEELVGLEGETRICGALSLRSSPCFLHYFVALLIRDSGPRAKTSQFEARNRVETRGVMNHAQRNVLFNVAKIWVTASVARSRYILSSFFGLIFRRLDGASGQIIHDKSWSLRTFQTCAFSSGLTSQTRIIYYLCSNLYLNLLY